MFIKIFYEKFSKHTKFLLENMLWTQPKCGYLTGSGNLKLTVWIKVFFQTQYLLAQKFELKKKKKYLKITNSNERLLWFALTINFIYSDVKDCVVPLVGKSLFCTPGF